MRTPRIGINQAANLMRDDGAVLMYSNDAGTYRVCLDADWESAVGYMTYGDARKIIVNNQMETEQKFMVTVYRMKKEVPVTSNITGGQ